MIAATAGEQFTAYTDGAPAGLVGQIGVTIEDVEGNVVLARTTADIVELEVGSGLYQYTGTAPPDPGAYALTWDTGGDAPQGSSELMQVNPAVGAEVVLPDEVPTAVNLQDIGVLIPWARRACEGPYGPPAGQASMADDVVYPMIADACSEIILLSGSLFGHQLLVVARDPRAGYPTRWETDAVLNQWESAVVICQLALDYWRFLFRDTKTTMSIKNEGTEYSYTLSATLIGGYMKQLAADRDKALEGLRSHNIILDRYASNIRVRDQATVAMLEWWDTNQFDANGGGLPGGQEAYAVPAIGLPFSAGWSGGP